jgi:hypothetical protein
MECRWLENGPSVPLGAFGPKREEVTKVTISICGYGGGFVTAEATNAPDTGKASGTEEPSGRIRATPAVNREANVIPRLLPPRHGPETDCPPCSTQHTHSNSTNLVATEA